jgi:hypothetical protein
LVSLKIVGSNGPHTRSPVVAGTETVVVWSTPWLHVNCRTNVTVIGDPPPFLT